MRGNESNGWPERNLTSSGFKGILERVANQFTPNHNSQYQPGFIPANSPHLGQQATLPELNHGRSMDTMGGVNADTLYSARSFSVTQEPFTSGHSSIGRTSSDLGARLANFSHENYPDIDGAMLSPVENIDGSIYYQKHFSSVFQNSYSNTPVSPNYGQNPNQTSAAQHFNTNYMLNSTPLQSTCSSFSPNMMPPIGTWEDTYIQSTSLYEDHENTIYNSGVPEVIRPDRGTNLVAPSALINPDPGVPIDKNVEENVLKCNLKPSYSDVLSKTPAAIKNNQFGFEQKSMVKSSGTSGPTYSHKGKKESNSKHSYSHAKQRSRNQLNAASNVSTNVNKQNKVGLDSFETVSMQQIDIETKSMEKRTFEADSNTKCGRKSDFQNNQSPLQLRKNRDKKASHVTDNTPAITKDQLNNQAISSQRKQTPKRTSFINNVRSSTPPAVPLKKNNSEAFSKSLKSSNDARLYGDAVSNEVTYNRRNNNNNDNSSCVGDNIYNKDVGAPGRGRKAKTVRGAEPRKTPAKKKIEHCVTNLEQLGAAWVLLKVWLCYALGAALWLYGILIDVLQISYGLSIRFGKEWLLLGKSKGLELRTAMASYWKSTKTYLIQKLWNLAGRGDKRRDGGLESNIPLPTTGEAAMKRLLACRGKDPYNILGVMRACSDEDIKKYYKRQAFMVRPDKNKQPGAEESFKILAHAFELIGEPERRAKYDNRLNAEAQLESEWSEMSSLLMRLKEKLEESANTIRCTNCGKRHKRVKQDRPVYGARYCGDCRICHGAREGDIWAESYLFGLRWRYYACMEGAIYDITNWASCQKENLKQLQANTHSVQYRIVSGKKTPHNKTNTEGHTEPELEDFFNNYCRDRFSQGGQQTQSENRKRRGKRKK